MGALLELVGRLPADLPAALFIVLHTVPGRPSTLPEILSHRGPLRATHAIHGETIEPRRVYVAPPDNHLLVAPGFVQVVRGPKENGHRPSVDALFRSASKSYGPRVIAVVLTGGLDCGTAGMLSVKSRDGIAIVQDPREARSPGMPQSALDHVAVDHVAPVAEIAELLVERTREPSGDWPTRFPRTLPEFEGEEHGLPLQIVCPHCTGAVTVVDLDGFKVFRCHVGHAFTPASMLAEQDDQVERSMWAALRALEENSFLLQRMAATASGDLKQRYRERAGLQLQHVQTLRRILLHGTDPVPPPPDPPGN